MRRSIRFVDTRKVQTLRCAALVARASWKLPILSVKGQGEGFTMFCFFWVFSVLLVVPSNCFTSSFDLPTNRVCRGRTRVMTLLTKRSGDVSFPEGDVGLENYSLIGKAMASIQDQTFVRLSSKPARRRRARNKSKKRLGEETKGDITLPSATLIELASGPELIGIDARIVELKRGMHLSVTYMYSTNHQVKNYAIEQPSVVHEALVRVLAILPPNEPITLETTASDYTIAARAATCQDSRPTVRPPNTAIAPSTSHDKAKQRSISSNSPAFLHMLGLTSPEGKPRPSMAKKVRQCEKFVEVVSSRLRSLQKTKGEGCNVSVYDFGCGQGYLTFSLHSALSSMPSINAVSTTGIDIRPALMDKVQLIANSLDAPTFSTLNFKQGFIDPNMELFASNDTNETVVKVMVALHACDTATDDAIYSGTANNADLIVLSPCCQKQVRRQLETIDHSDHPYTSLLSHGIYRERIAEQVTDAMRGLCLELAGYDVSIFEFVGGEHTARNVMITAVRKYTEVSSQFKEEMESKIKALAVLHGIRHQRLAEHMGLDLSGDASGDTRMNLKPGRAMPDL